MILLYYAYVGICSRHPHIALNKANGLVATAPLTSDWPRPSPLLDIPNWVNDVYLTGRGADAFIGSRFAESEPYAPCVIFLLPLCPQSSPVQQHSIPNVPSFAPTFRLHQEFVLFHRFRIIHPADHPRFAKPGLSCFLMVHVSIPPSSTLRGSASTIPLWDFDLPFLLFYPHRPYHSAPNNFDCITTNANERHFDEGIGRKLSALSSSTATSNNSSNNTNKLSSNQKNIKQTYQKKIQLEQILLRPDTYIGLTKLVTQSMLVYNSLTRRILQRKIAYTPGLYKIFDEIVVNASDNKQRNPDMDRLKVNMDASSNTISVLNNGRGIPIVMHGEHDCYVPTLIFRQ
jgi:hypothetical protein